MTGLSDKEDQSLAQINAMLSQKLLCSVCYTNEQKYTCPKCGIKTCSLPCVKKHKIQTECSGEIEHTKFISRDRLNQDKNFTNRDYNFLINTGRKIELGKLDVKRKAKAVFRGKDKGVESNKRPKADRSINDSRIHQIEKAYPQSAFPVSKRNNTLIISLPSGMSRSSINKSGYNKKASVYIWTVEWILLDQNNGEITRFISYRLKEDLTLRDAIPTNIIHSALYGKGSENKLDKNIMQFYLDNVIQPNDFSVLELDSLHSLTDAFSNKIVLEFPTVFVTFSNSIPTENIVKEDYAYSTGTNNLYNLEKNALQGNSDEDSVESSDGDSSDSSDISNSFGSSNLSSSGLSEASSSTASEHDLELNDGSGPEESSSKQLG